MAVTEHWNYLDAGKDYHGGFAFMSQGERPVSWAATPGRLPRPLGREAPPGDGQVQSHGGLKIVGEVEPRECNRVELAEELDQYGLRIPRVTFSYSENDKALQRHAIR